MKKTFFIIVCISPSFLYSMEPEKPRMPLSRSLSSPSDGSSGSPLITVKVLGRGRLDSNPIQKSPRVLDHQSPRMVDHPNLVRVRSQSRDNNRFSVEENLIKPKINEDGK